MTRLARAGVSILTALAVTAAQVAPAFARAEPMSRGEYEACQSRDEQGFRAAIEAITLRTLRAGIADFDYPAAVSDEWRKLGLDEVLDKRVDLAVDEVRNSSSWGSLLQSLADSSQAQKLATAVAERVYRSDAIKDAIERLASGVGRQVGARMEIASQDATEPALACLKAFLGPRYGEAIARSVASDAGREMGVDPSKGEGGISAGSVLKETSGGLAGAAIILVRRQLANMAERIGARIAGSILSRLVSLVAGGVGLVLIAKDIWDLRHGVLPIIATEMKAETTKEKVREEIAKSISEQIGDHVTEIAAKSAERVIEVWHDYKRAHSKALELAEGNDTFKSYLNNLKPDRIPRLDEVMSLVMASEGEGAILKRLGDGSLDEAVSRLPQKGMEIARETRSLEQGLRWTAVAGPELAKVAELELHKRAKAEDFTRSALQRVLSLGDRLAVTRVAGLKRETRDVLFEVDSAHLKTLARTLNENELDALARYLTGLQPKPRQTVLEGVAVRPAVMQELARPRVRDAILASRDQDAAVSMMLEPSAVLDLPAVIRDLRAAYEGQISPILVWEKHPAGVGLAAFAALILLLLLRRLLMPRRARPQPAQQAKPAVPAPADAAPPRSPPPPAAAA